MRTPTHREIDRVERCLGVYRTASTRREACQRHGSEWAAAAARRDERQAELELIREYRAAAGDRSPTVTPAVIEDWIRRLRAPCWGCQEPITACVCLTGDPA